MLILQISVLPCDDFLHYLRTYLEDFDQELGEDNMFAAQIGAQPNDVQMRAEPLLEMQNDNGKAVYSPNMAKSGNAVTAVNCDDTALTESVRKFCTFPFSHHFTRTQLKLKSGGKF